MGQHGESMNSFAATPIGPQRPLPSPLAAAEVAIEAAYWDQRRFISGLGAGKKYLALWGTPSARPQPLQPARRINRFSAPTGPGPSGTAYLSGRVTNPHGAALAGLRVEARHAFGSASFVSDEAGRYLLRLPWPIGETIDLGVAAEGRAWHGESLVVEGGCCCRIDAVAETVLFAPVNGAPQGVAWAQRNIVLDESAPLERGPVSRPLVYVESGVLEGAGFQPEIVPGGPVAIFGSGFGPAAGDRRPASSGVRVSIDGRSAAVTYAGANQLNIRAPQDLPLGPAEVVVETPSGTSEPVWVRVERVRPELFRRALDHATAHRLSGTPIAPMGLLRDEACTPAAQGETIRLLASGIDPADLAVRVEDYGADPFDVSSPEPGIWRFSIAVPPAGAGLKELSLLSGGVCSESQALLAVM